MRKSFIKHENLKKSLEEIYNSDLTDEMIDRFLNELRHSNLILAADIGESEIKFSLVPVDGRDYGMLFTDMDEFRKTFSDEEFGSQYYDFKVYQMLVEESMVDGFIVNPGSVGFLMKKELILALDELPEHEFSSDDVYSASELKHLKDSIDNADLEAFIEDPSNIGMYDELFEKISNSTLLTLMVSDDDLTSYLHDGVICLEKTGPLGYLYIDEIGGEYATVYTSQDKIANVSTSQNKYCQIVNFSQMAGFVLNDDMDGIIINPNCENILLTRDVLMEYYPVLEKTCNDSRLNTAIFHMFSIDEGHDELIGQ